MGKLPSIGTAYSHIVGKIEEKEPVVEPTEIPPSPEYAPASPIEGIKAFKSDMMIEPEIHI
jgi:hypothetical protein